MKRNEKKWKESKKGISLPSNFRKKDQCFEVDFVIFQFVQRILPILKKGESLKLLNNFNIKGSKNKQMNNTNRTLNFFSLEIFRKRGWILLIEWSWTKYEKKMQLGSGKQVIWKQINWKEGDKNFFSKKKRKNRDN